MFTKALFSSAVLAATAHAATDEEKAKYPHFELQMGIYQYDWEPFEVTTDDGYILTLMHVTNKKG